MFDLTKAEMRRLTDAQLRALVARLCEAEVTARAGLRRAVRWGGSQTAPDGGLDVEVGPEGGVTGDFVPRTWTGLQVKKPSMPAGSIRGEMTPGGVLRPIIREIAAAAGAYIVVTLDDGVDGLTAQARDARRRVMAEEVDRACGPTDIHLDVYGVDELLQWLRSHPGVALWTREALGLPLRGWKPHGRWTAVPVNMDDTLIFANGLSVKVPGLSSDNETNLISAIEAIRGLVREGSQAIRVAGLSGLGKTRIVQALFEEEVGANALDPATAIYADLGDAPDPPPRDVLARLVAERRSAVLVLDNCAPDVHARLAQEAAQAGATVRLVTVEYDVADDRPELTEVVRVDAAGPDICEALVRRRFPAIGQANARLVAEFSDGNARISLALAGVVERDETLTNLSNEDLFRRLFYQRRDDRGDGLLRSAEVLSLVYSFSVSPGEDGPGELDILGGLIGKDRRGIYGDAQELLSRRLAQRRGEWRAILPAAIANRLARNALDRLPVDELRRTFERNGHERLLTSFARRLGYLHDVPNAVAIAEAWLSPSGLLGALTDLTDVGQRMLAHIAPAAPEAVLTAIESSLRPVDEAVVRWRNAPALQTVVDLLVDLAHGDDLFDRCVEALAVLSRTKEEGTRHDSIRDKIFSLFPIYLSGTEAGPAQRARIVREFLASSDPDRVLLGQGMLATALKTDFFSLSRDMGFGARPRSFGWEPKSWEQQTAWFTTFLDVALDGQAAGDVSTQARVRSLLADRWRGLWRYQALRRRLVETAHTLHAKAPWLEGWRSVRGALWFDYREEARKNDPDGAEMLEALATELEPRNLADEVRAFVLETGSGNFTLFDELDPDDPERWSKGIEALNARAVKLGRTVAADSAILQVMLLDLLSAGTERNHYFGQGLAQASSDVSELWTQLLEALETVGEGRCNVGVACGVLQEVAGRDIDLAHNLVDNALQRPALRRFLVWWQTSLPLDARGIERLRRELTSYDELPFGFDTLLWRREFEALPVADVAFILRTALDRTKSQGVLLSALGMRCFRDQENGLPFASELVPVTLEVIRRLIAAREDEQGDGGMVEHYLSQVLRASLDPVEYPQECASLLAALAERVRARHGFVYGLDDAVRVLVDRMPEPFLDAILLDPSITRHARRQLLEGRLRGAHLLTGLSTERMLAWLKHDPQVRAPLMAASIQVYDEPEDGQGCRLSGQALALVAASPEPRSVVAAFARSAAPSSWSGNRSEIVARRRTALGALIDHPDQGVQAATTYHVHELEALEASDRAFELRQAKQDERFE